MAIGAARVMAAGKAGLESLPHFVDELMAQGIPQLAPWAIDHSQDQIDDLRGRTQSLVVGKWQDIFGIGISPPGITMETDSAATNNLLQRVNPLAAKTAELADSPAQLGAWCRRQIGQYCRATLTLWDQYKGQYGLAETYQLAVVIPFCPEGPTSGTVAMYLGAALRKHFADQNKSDQLVVLGIELCPPVAKDDAGEMDMIAVRSAFRGYVARQELLQGVPLSADPNDNDFHVPFDINIVFDGGTANSPLATHEDVLRAMDQAAAQVTACLLNGATSGGGGDKLEAIIHLKEQEQRWNAYLAHVVSERSYSEACRYLRYRVALPWHRDPETWDAATPEARRDAYLRRIDDDVLPYLSQEENAAVKTRVSHLVTLADDLRSISLKRKFADFLGRAHKDALKRVQGYLDSAVDEDNHNYTESCRASQDTNNIIARDDLFCINIVLPEEQRHEAAVIARDNGSPGPIAQVLGDAGIATVRNKITTLCNGVLRRPDCETVNIDSQAVYDEMVSISISDWSKNNINDQFRPSRENLSYYLAADCRLTPGSFSEMSFDLSDVVRQSASDDDNSSAQPAALDWKLRGVDHDIPVEYSILTLGRVRKGEGFKDISTYEELEQNYTNLVADLDRWRGLARYYGVKPPSEWFKDGRPAAEPTAAPGLSRHLPRAQCETAPDVSPRRSFRPAGGCARRPLVVAGGAAAGVPWRSRALAGR